VGLERTTRTHLRKRRNRWGLGSLRRNKMNKKKKKKKRLDIE
jgi:hypothetical protein